jgi:flagellar biosynthetic protein FliQ
VNELTVLELMKQAMTVGIEVSAPLLLASLMVGTTVGVLMAATQIQEFTLSFVPKLFAMGLVLLLMGPWMLRTLIAFTINIFQRLPGVLH